jgi:hypothetical protein
LAFVRLLVRRRTVHALIVRRRHALGGALRGRRRAWARTRRDVGQRRSAQQREQEQRGNGTSDRHASKRVHAPPETRA